MKMRALKAGIATLMSLMMVANVGLGTVSAEDYNGTGSNVATADIGYDGYSSEVEVTYDGRTFTGTVYTSNQGSYELYFAKFKVNEASTETFGSVLGVKMLNSTATKIVIPDTIKADGTKIVSVEAAAFRGNSTIEEVTLPAAVETIGESAFAQCSALREVKIGSGEVGLRYINSSAFLDCENLRHIPDGYFSNVIWICEKAFMNCVKLTNNIDFSTANLLWIDDYAFANCDAMTEVYIKHNVNEVGYGAFMHCDSLKKVTVVGDSDFKAGESVFSYCKNLEVADLQRARGQFSENMPAGTFSDCSSLKTVFINSTQKKIDRGVFTRCTSLESIKIPDSVTEIGSFAFDSCTSLSEITGGNNISLTNHSAFQNTPWMKSKISKGIIDKQPVILGKVLLNWTYASGDIKIPEGVATIGDNAFNYGLEGIIGYTGGPITSVYMPNSVKYIGQGAFSGETELTSITGGAGTEVIRHQAFKGCSKLDIIGCAESKQMKYLESEAITDTKYLSIIKLQTKGIIIIGNTFCDANGVTGKVVLPEGVKAVNADALDCNTVSTLVLPKSLEYIQETTLNGATNLSNLVMQGDVWYISVYGAAQPEGTTDLTVYTAKDITYDHDNYVDKLKKKYNTTENPAKLTIRNRLPVQGDVDGDGYMKINDLVNIKKYLVGVENTGVNLDFADVNNDGDVNVFDFIVMKRLWLQGN